jgi:hypothetical protein
MNLDAALKGEKDTRTLGFSAKRYGVNEKLRKRFSRSAAE